MVASTTGSQNQDSSALTVLLPENTISTFVCMYLRSKCMQLFLQLMLLLVSFSVHVCSLMFPHNRYKNIGTIRI